MKYIKIVFALLCIAQSLFCTPYDFTSLDALMGQAVRDKIFPGGVALINYQNKTVYHKAFGHYTYDAVSAPVLTHTLFDIASLTKIVATTTLAMIVCDAKLLFVEDPVVKYIPDFVGSGKNLICVKHLLTHTAGIGEKQVILLDMSAEQLWQTMLAYPVVEPVWTVYRYTCTNMILLQKIIENIMQLPFDECVKLFIVQPLGMQNTFFHPLNKLNCAPTRGVSIRGNIIQGTVHDDRAFMLGGVAGNAGLFSTAADLEKWMLMMLHGGSYIVDNVVKQLIQNVTVNTWISRQCPFNRGYGFEIGRHISSNAFGHFGWTGTSIWADAELQLGCILLTNRTYPTDDNFKIREFRVAFHDLIMKIINDAQ